MCAPRKVGKRGASVAAKDGRLTGNVGIQGTNCLIVNDSIYLQLNMIR